MRSTIASTDSSNQNRGETTRLNLLRRRWISIRSRAAHDTRWASELETAIAIKEVIRHMDGWTRKIWQARQYGYSWKEISKWLGVTEQQAKMKFRYGLGRLVRVCSENRSESQSL